MKQLAQLARRILHALGSRPDAHGGEPSGKRPLLLVSRQESDRKTLEQMLLDSQWRLWTADSFVEGLERLKSIRAPIVLCDRDLPGWDWRETLAKLMSLPHPAQVILLSPSGDHALWGNVIERGGFDVLTRPLRKGDVMPTLDCALRLWQAGGPQSPATK